MSVPLPPGHTVVNGDGSEPFVRKQRRREGQTDISIRVKGRPDPSWRAWLDGLQITHETDGASRFFGPLQDQPALFGVLAKIDRMNLTLVSFEISDLAHQE
jgi:hypothetical protein